MLGRSEVTISCTFTHSTGRSARLAADLNREALPDYVLTEETMTIEATTPATMKQKAATSPAPATVVSITNRLDSAVDIYDVFDPSTATQNSAIKYSKLATVAAGATTQVTMIRPIARLTAAVTGPVHELNGNYYDQFPVTAMSGTQVTFGTPPPLAYTIEATDRSAAILSFQFHKFAMANPTSALTQNFNAALKNGFAAVSTFFQGTDNFKACTVGSWHIVMTWLQNVTSGWQGPYFLYEAPSPVPANYVPQLIATLNIQSDATTNTAVLTMCGLDSSGNPIYATPVQQLTLTMRGDGTMQGMDPGGSGLSASLMPVWMNVIQTPLNASGDPVPKYLIGSAVTGTVAGKAVVSSQTARQLPGHPAPADDAKKQSSWDNLFTTSIEIIGALAGLIAIYDFVSRKKESADAAKEEAKKSAKSSGDLAAREQAIDKSVQAELADTTSGVPAIQASVDANAQTVSDGYSATVTEMQKATLVDAIETNVANVENQVNTDLANGVPPTESFEDAFASAQTHAQTAIEQVDDADFTSWRPALDQSLSSLSTEAAAATAEVQTAVENLQQSVAEAIEQTAAVEEAQQAREAALGNEANDSGASPDDINDQPETDEVPPAEVE